MQSVRLLLFKKVYENSRNLNFVKAASFWT